MPFYKIHSPKGEHKLPPAFSLLSRGCPLRPSEPARWEPGLHSRDEERLTCLLQGAGPARPLHGGLVPLLLLCLTFPPHLLCSSESSPSPLFCGPKSVHLSHMSFPGAPGPSLPVSFLGAPVNFPITPDIPRDKHCRVLYPNLCWNQVLQQ